MKTKTITIRDTTLSCNCLDFDDDGSWLDTKVFINDIFFMWIAGCDVDKLIEDFRKLYQYSI